MSFDPAVVTPEALVGAVEDAGFDGGLLSVKHPKQQLEVRGLGALSWVLCWQVPVCRGGAESSGQAP